MSNVVSCDEKYPLLSISSKLWCEDSLDQLLLLADLNSQMKMVAKSEGHDGLVAMNFVLP